MNLRTLAFLPLFLVSVFVIDVGKTQARVDCTIPDQVGCIEVPSAAFLKTSQISPCSLPEEIIWWTPKWRSMWYAVRQHCGIIQSSASKYDVDSKLISAVMFRESGGWPAAENRTTGAVGLMQVMPYHPCVSWEPSQNLDCGVMILDENLENYGLEKGLAAYNAGPDGMKDGLGITFSLEVIQIYENILASQ